MAKSALAEEVRERPSALERKPQDIGPFLTISREYGCHGFSLGLLLLDLLNEETTSGAAWQIYHKDILSRLETETNMAQDIIEHEMTSKPSLIVDFFRAFSKERAPSGFEIRNRITTIIRCLAIQGRAIIIGQGSAAATLDLPHGLAIRLEAPEEWRVRQVAFREGVTEYEARHKIHQVEQERDFLRKFYELKYPRRPAFHVTYDCSAFSLTELAQNVMYMMKLKHLV